MTSDIQTYHVIYSWVKHNYQVDLLPFLIAVDFIFWFTLYVMDCYEMI